ncbi:MAG: AmmeMemoRadiSam system radical SAM enzyme [Candidatus Odinarchaeia archaeon]
MKEAMFYKKLEDHKVQCLLCPHNCVILDSKRGICGVRENRDGVLYSLVYGKLIAEHVDPIEKKPLFHFYPSSLAYSIATVGCNMRCKNCQNADISQLPRYDPHIPGGETSPEQVVENAIRYGCDSIAYTYTEPTIFFEFAYETAKIAHKKGLKNVFVTNGYISEEALRYIAPYLDAANIDLKSARDEFYKEICGARLQPVLDSIKLYKELGIWIEVTTLVIPTLNDSEEELRKISQFVKDVGEEIPWHISRFHPMYQLTHLPYTSVEVLKKAYQIGQETGLRYVYIGNVWGTGEDTYCYKCGEVLIHRMGYDIKEYKIKNGVCPKCGAKIDIIPAK